MDALNGNDYYQQRIFEAAFKLFKSKSSIISSLTSGVLNNLAANNSKNVGLSIAATGFKVAEVGQNIARATELIGRLCDELGNQISHLAEAAPTIEGVFEKKLAPRIDINEARAIVAILRVSGYIQGNKLIKPVDNKVDGNIDFGHYNEHKASIIALCDKLYKAQSIDYSSQTKQLIAKLKSQTTDVILGTIRSGVVMPALSSPLAKLSDMVMDGLCQTAKDINDKLHGRPTDREIAQAKEAKEEQELRNKEQYLRSTASQIQRGETILEGQTGAASSDRNDRKKQPKSNETGSNLPKQPLVSVNTPIDLSGNSSLFMLMAGLNITSLNNVVFNTVKDPVTGEEKISLSSGPSYLTSPNILNTNNYHSNRSQQPRGIFSFGFASADASPIGGVLTPLYTYNIGFEIFAVPKIISFTAKVGRTFLPSVAEGIAAAPYVAGAGLIGGALLADNYNYELKSQELASLQNEASKLGLNHNDVVNAQTKLQDSLVLLGFDTFSQFSSTDLDIMRYQEAIANAKDKTINAETNTKSYTSNIGIATKPSDNNKPSTLLNEKHEVKITDFINLPQIHEPSIPFPGSIVVQDKVPLFSIRKHEPNISSYVFRTPVQDYSKLFKPAVYEILDINKKVSDKSFIDYINVNNDILNKAKGKSEDKNKDQAFGAAKAVTSPGDMEPDEDPDDEENKKENNKLNFKKSNFEFGDSIGLHRFTQRLKEGKLKDPKSGQVIEPDRAKNSGVGPHNGSYWKLYDKVDGKRIGTVTKDGKWLRR